MSEKPFDAEVLIDALLPLLDITLSAESRAAVKMNLEVAERISRLVTSFQLEDEAEPAPVYTA